MNPKGRVLIVDDEPNWREALVEGLLQKNIFAEAVSTTEEALQKLRRSFYHVLILDVCFEEGNTTNSEGMLFLKELQSRKLAETLKVVMLSGYGTTESMREAFREHQVHDFFDKSDFDIFAFSEDIENLLQNKLDFNLHLEIFWDPKRIQEQAIERLELEDEYMEFFTDFQQQLLPELEDLLRRLFHKAIKIHVRSLHPGFSGMRVLWIQPFYKDGGGGQPTVLKFGNRTRLRAEEYNFRTYVQPFITGGYNTTILETRHTPHLGGIVYPFLQLPKEPLKDFSVFYPQATSKQIQNALDRLFLHTCKVWYSGMGTTELYNLTDDYQRLLGGSLAKIIEEISEGRMLSIPEQQRFSLPSLPHGRDFTNPFMCILERTYICSTYICITHGDLNQHNLLLDGNGNTWLIDFQDTGRSHFLRDLTMLDSIIRYQLISSEEATLEELLHMETTLLSISNYNELESLMEKFATTNKALEKAYASIVHLRMLARKITASKFIEDMREYYIGLLYHAFNTLRFSSLSLQQREHALLCCSLLLDTLK